MDRLRATIGLLILGCCTPVLALDLQGSGITVDNWGLTEGSDYRPALTIGDRDWWNQSWRTYQGINLEPFRNSEQAASWPTRMNLTHRFTEPGQHSAVNAGIGVQTIDFSPSRSHQGLRLSLGGRFGFSNGVTVYGESAWVPGLLDSGTVDSLSGLHFETGVMLNPLPYLSIRAAYRRYNLDYTLIGGVDEYATSQGIMIGTGLHW